MKNKVAIFALIGGVFLSGCASTKKSVWTGIGVGAATGGITGAVINQRNKERWALSGVFIGAAIGGLGSYMIHHSLQERDEKVRKETLLTLDKFSSSMPSKESGAQDFKLSPPDVHKECFDWQIRGEKLVQKHCVWTINGHSFWVPFVEKGDK